MGARLKVPLKHFDTIVMITLMFKGFQEIFNLISYLIFNLTERCQRITDGIFFESWYRSWHGSKFYSFSTQWMTFLLQINRWIVNTIWFRFPSLKPLNTIELWYWRGFSGAFNWAPVSRTPVRLIAVVFFLVWSLTMLQVWSEVNQVLKLKRINLSLPS